MSKRFTYALLIGIVIGLDILSCFLLARMTHHDALAFIWPKQTETALRLWFFTLIWTSSALYYSIYRLKRADRFLAVASRHLSHLITLFIAIQAIKTLYFSTPFQAKDYFFLGILSITQISYRFFLVLIVHFLRARVHLFREKVVVLGDEAQTRELTKFILNNPKIGYDIETISLDNPTAFTESNVDIKGISAVYIHENNMSKKKFKKPLEKLALAQLPIYIFADHDAVMKSAQVDYFGFIPVYKTQFSPLLQGTNKAIKRTFDILFSLAVMLFILSWLYPIVAIFILMESKGPVLFVQHRNGIRNHLFKCFKFRSMTINSEEAQAQKNDNRITKIGRIIRRTSIDEFPQFFNVLKGDMSVVGPRPHMEIHNKNYAKHVESFQLRHTVKPGITGMAQARGFRGEIKADADIINRIKYDIFYIRHWSFALDIKIILRTVLNIFRGDEKAY